MTWRLRLSRRAEKQLRALPPRDREAVIRALERLVADPDSSSIKKLTDGGGEWRLRVGRLRVRFEFDAANHCIDVTRILPRDQAYRD